MNNLSKNTEQKSSPSPRPSTRHVMVIDDNAEIRANFKIFFNQLGFNVVEAANGLDALHKLVIHGGPDTFSLIITDLLMPNMNGAEFILKLRQKYKDCKTPIMVCSVKSEQSIIKNVISIGINDYLLKPVNFSALLNKLKSILPTK